MADLNINFKTDLNELGKGTPQSGGFFVGNNYIPLNSDPIVQTQIENFFRTKEAKTYKELFATQMPSFDDVRKRAENLKSATQLTGLTKKELAKQISYLKDYRAQLDNSLNTLLTRVRMRLDKLYASSDNPDPELIEFYASKEEELIAASAEIKEVYEQSIKELETNIPLSAQEGYATGSAERLKKDKAKELAFRKTKQFIETNKNILPRSKLGQAARAYYDSIYTDAMSRDNIPVVPKDLPTATMDTPSGNIPIPPNRGNLSSILPDPESDGVISAFGRVKSIGDIASSFLDIMIKVRDIFATFYINLLKAYEKATSKDGIRGSEAADLFGRSTSFSINSVGGISGTIGGAVAGGILGSAVPGIGNLVGIGVGATAGNQIGGQLANLTGVDKILEAITTTYKISENLSDRGRPFSAELIQTRIDKQLNMLEQSIETGSRYGAGLSEIEAATNVLQDQLYSEALRFIDDVRPFLVTMLHLMTLMAEGIRIVALSVSNMLQVIGSFSSVAGNAFKGMTGLITKWNNDWLKKNSKTRKIDNFESDLMKNRPPGV